MTIALVIDDNKQTTEALVQMLKIWDISSPSSLRAKRSNENPGRINPNIVFPGH